MDLQTFNTKTSERASSHLHKMSGQSQKDGESSENDVWDDSLLIKSYDKSVRLAKKALAKKIARATNKNNKTESSDIAAIKNTSEEPVQNSFKVGDYVRATYEDGVDYEAKIISIDDSNEECLLKYVGYENEQTVKLADLIPSWGKRFRRKQFEQAKKGDKSQQPELHGIPDVPSMFGRLPPPPPMPPNLTDEDSEHLSAMLMSWYMSGYYTGFYHGQRTQKTPRRK